MELLAIGEVAARAGVAPSALRYYEQQGLIVGDADAGRARGATRAACCGGWRSSGRRRTSACRWPRSARRWTPCPRTGRRRRADWARLSRAWRDRLDEQIAALTQLRDGLSSCIGCGCLSLGRCALSNPGDVAGRAGPGARWLPPALRRVPPVSNAG